MASVIGVDIGNSGPERRRRSGKRPPAARLLNACPEPAPLSRRDATRISDAEVDAFAPLAISLEAHDLLAEVDIYLARGYSAERIFVELLAPVARRLGDDWTADRIDFLDVTMALWRLQEVLREVAARTPPGPGSVTSRRVLFSPLPGDQHAFGAAMIDECFTRAGWSSNLLIEPSRGSLLAAVAAAEYDLVGLTVTCDCHIGPLTALIVAIRNVSRNSNVRVMLGGRLLIEDPGLADRAGADATAATAVDALDIAERLVMEPLNAAYA
ncbi:cobalamin B12-binding domain-containing protein [Sphingomonas glaciei]|uniref:Cobalamin B12-binding domain-containing protein n=1 Tax=Sphingomonas glaciei TaxID=2938948 RepID=A0ABY5MUQ7_9SPHN|nr:B12-binding domain-containing protein [Sphingomonas glaciei]UUR07958.1 cobalamin B12-binding domain-containing protein [Sphingomonas glaciei]